ncbi:MAG: DUF935 domain-containing protein [Bacteroidales bacterium]|jgi:hypothetical protein|nr:DUF935 domain-containing protein [Bacteroidales bacterium]
MTKKKQTPQISTQLVQRQIPQVRRDIADWKRAVRMATATTNPKQYLLQEIYTDISNDALLSSQLNNRNEQTISAGFELVTADGKVNDHATATLNTIPCLRDIIGHILNSEWYGCSLVEIFTDQNGINRATLIDRRHVVSELGILYPNVSQSTGIAYRSVAEYGTSLIEFNAEHLGLLNKSVNHILFKKFAQSCWSELCEIYGIPPRYLKTNTRDKAMLDRAEQMMREMGAATWAVIDSTEEFSFLQGVNTNGDVYANLIRLCNNETSLLVSGAIIGQDTQNGNRSKEELSIEMLNRLIESDKRMVEMYINSVVLPAFRAMGWLPAGTEIFRFSASENTAKLWEIVKELLPYKEVDNKWIEEKFGVPVADKFAAPAPMGAGVTAALQNSFPTPLWGEAARGAFAAEPGDLSFFD